MIMHSGMRMWWSVMASTKFRFDHVWTCLQSFLIIYVSWVGEMSRNPARWSFWSANNACDTNRFATANLVWRIRLDFWGAVLKRSSVVAWVFWYVSFTAHVCFSQDWTLFSFVAFVSATMKWGQVDIKTFGGLVAHSLPTHPTHTHTHKLSFTLHTNERPLKRHWLWDKMACTQQRRQASFCPKAETKLKCLACSWMKSQPEDLKQGLLAFRNKIQTQKGLKKKNSVCYGKTQHVVYGMTQHVVYGMIQHVVYGKIQHVLFSRVLCSLLCVWMKSSKTRCREHMF